MLEVQKYLHAKTRSGLDAAGAVGALADELSIRPAFHPAEPIVILNYDQLDSPRRHPIAMECRGLTLELGSWDVVARAFTRFFNAGECPDLEREFDWSDFTAESKEDGSLMLFYRYEGQWMVNTRGSFAQGEIYPGVGKTWSEVFCGAVGNMAAVERLPGRATFVFELCSPYNKVVRQYREPTLYLLTAFHNQSGAELGDAALDGLALEMGVKRPTRYPLATLGQVREFLEKQGDPTFEGVVLRDRKGMRLKVKNPSYVALHHLHANGNAFHPRRLLPLVLKGEEGELLAYYPEMADRVFDMVERLQGARARMMAVWEAAKGMRSQKDFALYVTKHTPLSAILFEARKRGVEPEEVWRRSEELLLKRLRLEEV